jgi:hypothetical protein
VFKPGSTAADPLAPSFGGGFFGALALLYITK